VAQNEGYLRNYIKKTAHNKLSPNGRKFAQSGRPAASCRMKAEAASFRAKSASASNLADDPISQSESPDGVSSISHFPVHPISNDQVNPSNN
jgi:hypothetical protein